VVPGGGYSAEAAFCALASALEMNSAAAREPFLR
jgi:hypothetical protein